MAQNETARTPPGVPGWIYAVVLTPLALIVGALVSEPLGRTLAKRLPLVRRPVLLGILGVTVLVHGAEAVWLGRRAKAAGLNPVPWMARVFAVGSLALGALKKAEAQNLGDF